MVHPPLMVPNGLVLRSFLFSGTDKAQAATA
jgi:hypothetical protein